MGPRRRRRGRRSKATVCTRRKSEKCELQHWGHDEGVVGQSGPGAPARGAAESRKLRSWGHDEGVVEGNLNRPDRSRARPRSAVCAFNGATTKRCRGRSIAGISPVQQHVGAIHASMGPRRRCRGRDGQSSWDQFVADHFAASMGPRRMSRGRRCPCQSGRCWGKSTISRLQWGHDEGVVGRPLAAPESSSDRSRASNGATTKVSWKRPLGRRTDTHSMGCPNIASMGPRRRCRGVGARLSDGRSSLGDGVLQWGHDNGVVESRLRLLPATGVCLESRFNGATTKVSRGRR